MNETPPTNTEATGPGLTARAVREMSDDALRIRVAELCGWKGVHVYEDNAGPPILCGDPPPTYKKKHKYDTAVPVFTSDLNAMAEAEKDAPIGYADIVRQIVARDAAVAPQHLCDQYLVRATARQRAEAFVLTLSPNATTLQPHTEGHSTD